MRTYYLFSYNYSIAAVLLSTCPEIQILPQSARLTKLTVYMRHLLLWKRQPLMIPEKQLQIANAYLAAQILSTHMNTPMWSSADMTCFTYPRTKKVIIGKILYSITSIDNMFFRFPPWVQEWHFYSWQHGSLAYLLWKAAFCCPWKRTAVYHYWNNLQHWRTSWIVLGVQYTQSRGIHLLLHS